MIDKSLGCSDIVTSCLSQFFPVSFAIFLLNKLGLDYASSLFKFLFNLNDKNQTISLLQIDEKALALNHLKFH